jgi:hypothetical protein
MWWTFKVGTTDGNGEMFIGALGPKGGSWRDGQQNVGGPSKNFPPPIGHHAGADEDVPTTGPGVSGLDELLHGRLCNAGRGEPEEGSVPLVGSLKPIRRLQPYGICRTPSLDPGEEGGRGLKGSVLEWYKLKHVCPSHDALSQIPPGQTVASLVNHPPTSNPNDSQENLPRHLQLPEPYNHLMQCLAWGSTVEKAPLKTMLSVKRNIVLPYGNL